jgi:DNA-binding MarR family transcriptional regulator
MKEKHISEVRAFNRFYTPVIGLLDKYVLHNRFSLPEVRVLYEVYHRDPCTPSDIIATLGIDKGYLSRILGYFEKKKWVTKKKAGHDSRAIFLSLTAAGKKEMETLNEASNQHIRTILEHLNDEECNRLIHHMSEIKMILTIPERN